MKIWMNPFEYGEQQVGVSVTKQLEEGDEVPCMECGGKFKSLTASHLQTHDMTLDDYREEHGHERYIDVGVAFGIENLEVGGKGAPVRDEDENVQAFVNAKGNAFQLTLLEGDEENPEYNDEGVLSRSAMEERIEQKGNGGDPTGLTFSKDVGPTNT